MNTNKLRVTREEIAANYKDRTSTTEAAVLWGKAEEWAAEIVSSAPGTRRAKDAQWVLAKASALVVKAQVSRQRTLVAFDAARFHKMLAYLADQAVRCAV